MSAMPGTVVTIKTEVLSDVEAISSDDEESEVVTCGLPQTVLTTNYHDQRLPMLEDFLGPYKFTFQLPKDGSSIKPAWDYSDILKQVFIKVDRILVVQFSFNSSELNMKDIFIRAVLVYSSADHVYSPVNRCLVHAIEDDPLAKSHLRRGQCQCPMYNLAGHVVRCRSVEAIYCYDPKSERHSVLCPVKSTADLLYSFSCKNSCPKGMNRRGTKLVFTLENGSGKMLGRTSLDVKVCSCPRRDKEKLEGQILKNSVPQAEGNTSLPSCQPPAKVRRLMNVDTSSPSVGVKPPTKDIQADDVPGQRKEDEDELVIAEDDYLPGEVIMKIRSEIRNIRQVLNVAERRFSGVQGLLNDSLHS